MSRENVIYDLMVGGEDLEEVFALTRFHRNSNLIKEEEDIEGEESL